MNDDLNLRVRRWQDADAAGLDDDADGVCRGVFRAIERDQEVSPAFTSAALGAIAAAAAADARRARQMRRLVAIGGAALMAVGLYFAGGWLLWTISRVFLGALDLLVGVIVRVASGVHTGTDFWTLLANLGRATAAFVANPSVTVAILAMQGIAMAAIVALHRLLGSDRESLK